MITWHGLVRQLRHQRVLAIFDSLAWALALLIGLGLRYIDEHLGAPTLSWVWGLIANLLVFHLLATGAYMYRHRYMFGSKEEVIVIARVAFLTGVIVGVCDLLWRPSRPMPVSVCALVWLLALFFMVAIRAAIRSITDSSNHSGNTPALILGLGVAGRQVLDTLIADPVSPYRPVGLLDDDPAKHVMHLRGLKCFGGVDALASAVERTGARALIVAVVTGSPKFYQRVSKAASELNLEVKIVPPLSSIVSQSTAIRDLNDISISDLLGRREIETNFDQVRALLEGRRVLVTGAGGSIGSELCRQLSRFDLAELIMLDRDESALHGVQLSLYSRALLDTPDVVLADIRDKHAVFEIFASRRPHIVFHAAALKHLPMLEQYPAEAWKTNVLGTANILEAAAASDVQVFVNISTDKAADPSSNLGYSKRIAERLTAWMGGQHPGQWLSVRFGNVLGSRGSVLVSFADQIAQGGPITVTHPDTTRYFMTIGEAVQLTLQAAAIGDSGSTLVLDMGTPVKIVDVAQEMIALSKRHIQVVFTGLRPGEKLHEKLFGNQETVSTTNHSLVQSVRVSPLPIQELEHADVAQLRRLAEIGVPDQRGHHVL